MSNNMDYYCRTESQRKTAQMTWTIEGFRNFEYFSDIFKAIDLDGKETEWQMQIIPKDEVYDENNGIKCAAPNEYISLYVIFNPSKPGHQGHDVLYANTHGQHIFRQSLFYQNSSVPQPQLLSANSSSALSYDEPKLHANLQVAIKNSKGEEVFGQSMFIKTGINRKMPYPFSSFLKKDILFDPKNGLLPGGKLTIVCKIEWVKAMNTSKDMPEIIVPGGSLMAEIGNLFEKMNFSDCIVTIISADNKELKISKCILASHSPVFAAMFEHGTIESQNNTITIDDFDANVLKQMLQYMYNGDGDKVNFVNIEDKLLTAANKYGLERLKALCERELAHSMTVRNACELLILATLYSAEQLKFYAIAYIKKHENQVKESDGWKMLAEEHLDMLEIYD